MTSGAAWRQALKDHGRYQPKQLDEVPVAVADIIGESDRGAVLLASTLIEDALESRLLNAMVGLSGAASDYRLLFGMDAPVSTFSAKSRLAYALGIIDRRALDQIDLIRDIRNACAHARMPTSFATPVVTKAVENLISDLQVLAENAPSVRDLFVIKCLLVVEYVMDGRWRTTSDDILEIIAAADAAGDLHDLKDSGRD